MSPGEGEADGEGQESLLCETVPSCIPKAIVVE